MAGFTAYIAETLTGNVIVPLTLGRVSSFRRELSGVDYASALLTLGAVSDPKTRQARDTLRNYTTPARMCLLVDFQGSLIFAGPIWSRNWDGKQLTINATGPKSLLSRRKILNSLASPWITQTMAYTGLSLGSIAIQLVQLATIATKTGATLPIVFPGTEADTDVSHARTYYGFQLTTTSDAIEDLTAASGGPDIDFVPSWTDGTKTAFQWTMRTGTMASPTLLPLNIVSLDATAANSPVQKLTVLEDATTLTTQQWAKGAGSDLDTLIAGASSAALTAAGFPLLESETDYTDTTTQAALNGQAAGDLATNAGLVQQFGLTVNSLTVPQIGPSLGIGDTVLVKVKDHAWVPDSPLAGYSTRLVAFQGDGGMGVDLEVQ